MKKAIEYHEVTVTFTVSEREVRRVTGEANKEKAHQRLVRMIKASLGDNTTNVMDVEDVVVVIDRKQQLEE